jgi:hypothetical protein
MSAHKLREETRRHFDNILDTFTASDGGVRFCKIKFFLEELDRRVVEEGDIDADRIIGLMVKFSKLIDISQDQGKVVKNGDKAKEVSK